MLLYNVTVGVDKDVEQDWLVWIKSHHIPAVLNTGLFESSKVYKILHDQEDGTVSYSIQFFSTHIEKVTEYLQVFAPKLIEDHRQQFANKHVVFQTLLEEV
ncbi:MAG TPA: DUF4286 family protein [Chryseosolibacter sp.]|nr:DUF4286 family protein [Chryseosolibacter sp.]